MSIRRATNHLGQECQVFSVQVLVPVTRLPKYKTQASSEDKTLRDYLTQEAQAGVDNALFDEDAFTDN